MEKTNKYYGIIENLVRNHKKFAGLEAILDEIIDDVYSHSEVIINSINNDSVINAYLEKVVSTSIITVPKRLKNGANISAKPAFETGVVQRANTELVDKMINGAAEEEKMPVIEEASLDEEDFTENIEDEELLEALELENGEQNDEQVEEVIEEALDEPIVLQEEIVEAPIEVQVEETTEEPVEELAMDFEENIEEELSEPTVLQEETEAVKEETEEKEEEVEEDALIQEELLLEEETPQDNLSLTEFANVEQKNAEFETCDLEEEPALDFSIEPQETSDDVIIENAVEEENEPLELVEEVEEAGEFENDEELSPVLDIEENIIDNNINEFEETEALEELPVEDTLLSDDTEEEETFNLEGLSLQDDVSETDDLEEVEELQELTPIEEEQKEPTDTIDYSAFEFTPENVINEFDAEEIAENIKQISSKRPELKITSVFNLKYKENHSVEEISEELGMSKENVLEALSEIIATV